MGKAKILGYNKPYIPNNRADMRKAKVWQRNREYTDKHEYVCTEKRERKICAELMAMKEA